MHLWEKIKAFNDEWNDLPRRLLWIVLLIGCLFLLLFAFRYVAPFVLAALFARLIDPVVRWVSRLLGGSKLARNIAVGLLVALLAGLVILILLVVMGRIFEEIKALAIALPGWIGAVSSDVFTWIDGLELEWGLLDSGVEEALVRLVSEATAMLTSLASRLASTVARVAWQAAGFLPQGVLFIVLTLMGTFYMSADKDRITGFLKDLLPEKHRARSNVFRASILRAVLGQLRAGFIMLFITFGELSLGFLLMGMDYAVLLALGIALLDALPVIGAGLFLIPMMLYGIVVGNVTLAVGAGLIYLVTIIVRQLLEPRIIGRQLGLYPLATMMAMYAGLQVMGVLGMLLGPMTFLLCKVALTAGKAEEKDGDAPLPPADEENGNGAGETDKGSGDEDETET